MNRYLIVDDDELRRNKISELLVKNHSIPELFIDKAECLSEAKIFLMGTFYTYAFIDVALPELKNGDVIPEGGMEILKAIKRERYKTPGRILFYTGLEETVSIKHGDYSEEGFELIYSPPNDYSWLDRKKGEIDHSSLVFNNMGDRNKNVALLSVHGIRTFGRWQEDLYKLCDESGDFDTFTTISYKFPLFSTTSFLFPSKRDLKVEEFKINLIKFLRKNRTRRIVFVAHSFGTYVLINAIKNLEDKSLLRELDLIILCGSVLLPSFDFECLGLDDNVSIINECGVNDIPLAINEALIPKVGLAGVIGFNGFSGLNVINRYHIGGHGCFFKVKFMHDNWLPVLRNPKRIPHINNGDSQNIFYKYFILKICQSIGAAKRFIFK